MKFFQISVLWREVVALILNHQEIFPSRTPAKSLPSRHTRVVRGAQPKERDDWACFAVILGAAGGATARKVGAAGARRVLSARPARAGGAA